MTEDLTDRLQRMTAGPTARPALDELWRRGRAARRRRRTLAGSAGMVALVVLSVAALARAGSDGEQQLSAGPRLEGSAAGPRAGALDPPPEPTDLPVTIAVGDERGLAYGGARFEVTAIETDSGRWTRGDDAAWESWDGRSWRRTHELRAAGPDDPESYAISSDEVPPDVGDDRFAAADPAVFVTPPPSEAATGWHRVCVVYRDDSPNQVRPCVQVHLTGEEWGERGPTTTAVDGASDPTTSATSAGNGDSGDPTPSEGTTSTTSPAPPPAPEAGDAASWMIDPADPPSAESSSFTALVTRVGCSGGLTGQVLRPGVVLAETEVVITFTVAAQSGPAPCPTNDSVAVEVELLEPIGDRVLVDRPCNISETGATSYCEPPGVRWPAEPGSGG